MESTASFALEVSPRSVAQVIQPQRLSRAEVANQWTHGLGFVLTLAAAALMLTATVSKPSSPRFIGCAIYLFGLVGTYAASTLSHSFVNPDRRNLFRLLDQVCILLLAAGSYTPFGLVHLANGWWLLLLTLIWTLALTGIVIRCWKGAGSVSFLFFALLGWLPVLSLGEVWQLAGSTGLGLVLAGACAYTGGLWFLVNDHRHTYLHAVWHICTIIGSGCHFLFLQWYVAEWPIA
jgi:hemolysin III